MKTTSVFRDVQNLVTITPNRGKGDHKRVRANGRQTFVTWSRKDYPLWHFRKILVDELGFSEEQLPPYLRK